MSNIVWYPPPYAVTGEATDQKTPFDRRCLIWAASAADIVADDAVMASEEGGTQQSADPETITGWDEHKLKRQYGPSKIVAEDSELGRVVASVTATEFIVKEGIVEGTQKTATA